MKVLLLDFEATGVDTKTARPLEIGAMVTDAEFNEPEVGISQLLYSNDYPEITPEVTRVTGITHEMLLRDSITPGAGLGILANIASDVDFVIAYNCEYDRGLFLAECERLGLFSHQPVQDLANKPWLCAMRDIESNYAFKSWKLMHVALEYGVTVNPKELHRALADVELMRKMLKASGVTPQQMLEFQQEPWIVVRAHTRKPWEDGNRTNSIAKEHGFRWQQVPGSDRVYQGMWVKQIKEKHFTDLMTKCPLRLERVP
jgi:DNA polymerase III epsilon subunit-like protein